MLLRIVKGLREYRNLYAVQHRLGGRMIYPESLKFLLLYGLALCKSIPLRGGYADAQLDERCAAGYNMMILPVKRLLKLLYPSFIRIDDYLVKVHVLGCISFLKYYLFCRWLIFGLVGVDLENFLKCRALLVQMTGAKS